MEIEMNYSICSNLLIDTFLVLFAALHYICFNKIDDPSLLNPIKNHKKTFSHENTIYRSVSNSGCLKSYHDEGNDDDTS